MTQANKTAKATKGPWLQIGSNIVIHEGNYTTGAPRSSTIASVMDPHDNVHQTEIALANARLIAVAPEMKEALELEAAWLASVITLRNTGLNVPKLLVEQISRRLETIRTLLAKTEAC